jgi:hypothetical protein
MVIIHHHNLGKYKGADIEDMLAECTGGRVSEETLAILSQRRSHMDKFMEIVENVKLKTLLIERQTHNRPSGLRETVHAYFINDCAGHALRQMDPADTQAYFDALAAVAKCTRPGREYEGEFYLFMDIAKEMTRNIDRCHRSIDNLINVDKIRADIVPVIWGLVTKRAAIPISPADYTNIIKEANRRYIDMMKEMYTRNEEHGVLTTT